MMSNISLLGNTVSVFKGRQNLIRHGAPGLEKMFTYERDVKMCMSNCFTYISSRYQRRNIQTYWLLAKRDRSLQDQKAKSSVTVRLLF